MRFTAQEEYGLRCLLQVAREPGGFTTVPAVARRERLTRSYVAKLFGILRHAGLLESVRGKRGGFRLARTAERVDVGSVLAALDAPLYCDDFCDRYTGGVQECVHNGDCSIRALWATIDGAVAERLSQTTLKDLLRRERGMKDWLQIELGPPATRRLERPRSGQV